MKAYGRYVEFWRDLEIWVTGLLRSFKMAPAERPNDLLWNGVPL